MYPNELSLHVLKILLFTSSTKELAIHLWNTIPDVITWLTPNVFVVVFFKLRINSSIAFDRFLFCNRPFRPKSEIATSKLPAFNAHYAKMKFSIKDFFSKFDQICSVLRIWSHLLKKSLMENFIFVQG